MKLTTVVRDSKAAKLTAYKNNQIIYLGDATVKHWDELTPNQLKIAMFSASQVRAEDTAETKYTMTFRQFAELCQFDEDTTGGKDYERIYKEARKLSKLGVDFIAANGDLVGFNWLNSVRVSPKSGTVSFKLDESLLPFYKTRRGTFAIIELLDYMPLRGRYALMLYEFLAKWKAAGKVYQSVDDLRQQFRVSPGLYPRSVDFMRRVVDGAVEEINKKATVSFYVKMVENRGKNAKVEGVTFHILPIHSEARELSEPRELLRECRVDAPAAAAIVEKYTRERILGNISKAKEMEAAGKIKKSLAATICAAIKDDYAGVEQTQLFEAAPEKEEEKEKCPECGGTGMITDFSANQTSVCLRCNPPKPAPAPGTEDPDAPWKLEGAGAEIAKALAEAMK